ncbi:olfactory receptor 11L1-like [Engystomops pustulosus]|uniref:olfactory receptor 11L1-like n=1 Tax=Engystomops pustulosus TaxID=76066 RepID=UPI003AFA7DDC
MVAYLKKFKQLVVMLVITSTHQDILELVFHNSLLLLTSFPTNIMQGINRSTVVVIHLLGFQDTHRITFVVFSLFFVVYCVTIFGNLLIIVVVSYSRSLHSPMYFFLTHLSLSDIILATDILPNILQALVVKDDVMSFGDCLAQFYFFDVAETADCLLLTVMCYDRYLAICRPLHYTSMVNHQFCLTTVTVTWTLSICVVLIHTITITTLNFCGPNRIDHFFCDLDPILQLSCSDITVVELEVTLLSALLVVIPFFIIIISYIFIIFTILQILSITGRQKAFSTCSSHLLVVSMYYGTLLCVYLVPDRNNSGTITKYLSLLYTVVTPLMNPIIYSLRNKDLQNVVENIVRDLCNIQRSHQ